MFSAGGLDLGAFCLELPDWRLGLGLRAEGG